MAVGIAQAMSGGEDEGWRRGVCRRCEDLGEVGVSGVLSQERPRGEAPSLGPLCDQGTDEVIGGQAGDGVVTRAKKDGGPLVGHGGAGLVIDHAGGVPAVLLGAVEAQTAGRVLHREKVLQIEGDAYRIAGQQEVVRDPVREDAPGLAAMAGQPRAPVLARAVLQNLHLASAEPPATMLDQRREGVAHRRWLGFVEDDPPACLGRVLSVDPQGQAPMGRARPAQQTPQPVEEARRGIRRRRAVAEVGQGAGHLGRRHQGLAGGAGQSIEAQLWHGGPPALQAGLPAA